MTGSREGKTDEKELNLEAVYTIINYYNITRHKVPCMP